MKSYRRLPAVTASLLLMGSACSSDNSVVRQSSTEGGASTGVGAGTGTGSASAATSGGSTAKGSTTGTGGAHDTSTRDATLPSSGGVTISNGGASAPGGITHTGGSLASGGVVGTASTRASGGAAGVGGSRASGGAVSAGSATVDRTTNSAGRANQGGSSAVGGAMSVGGQLASGGSAGTAGTAGASGTTATVTGPCDIFKSAGTPCVAAHSTVRALFGAYGGKLYQVRRADNTTKDIVTLTTGGFADGPSQDTFCSGTTCVITVVYDQSGKGNDLWYQGSTAVPGSSQSSPAKATTESLSVNGHKVYSLYINPGNSYWRDGSQSDVPTGSAPEGLYMVTSGTHVNGGCCFDYGNSETTRKADAAGAMDAINFGTQCWFGGCTGSGPWVQADLEWGLFPGGSSSWNSNQKAFSNKYVTAMLKNNGTTEFAMKGGNAQSGDLTPLYTGKLPSGYSPMKKQGAIVLGSGGDCCKPDGGANLSAGTFYEGAVVSGYPTDATDAAIQSNIVDAGYGLTAGAYLYSNDKQPDIL
jgi:non-reducing end alpha-L-arabinofuranosidase